MICHSEVVWLNKQLEDRFTSHRRSGVLVRGVPGIGKSLGCIAFAMSKLSSKQANKLLYVHFPGFAVVARADGPIELVAVSSDGLLGLLRKQKPDIVLLDGIKLHIWKSLLISDLVAESKRSAFTIVASSAPITPSVENPLHVVEPVSWQWDEIKYFLKSDSAHAITFRGDRLVQQALLAWHPNAGQYAAQSWVSFLFQFLLKLGPNASRSR